MQFLLLCVAARWQFEDVFIEAPGAVVGQRTVHEYHRLTGTDIQVFDRMTIDADQLGAWQYEVVEILAAASGTESRSNQSSFHVFQKAVRKAHRPIDFECAFMRNAGVEIAQSLD